MQAGGKRPAQGAGHRCTEHSTKHGSSNGRFGVSRTGLLAVPALVHCPRSRTVPVCISPVILQVLTRTPRPTAVSSDVLVVLVILVKHRSLFGPDQSTRWCRCGVYTEQGVCTVECWLYSRIEQRVHTQETRTRRKKARLRTCNGLQEDNIFRNPYIRMLMLVFCKTHPLSNLQEEIQLDRFPVSPEFYEQ